jgi:hypothetical protein
MLSFFSVAVARYRLSWAIYFLSDRDYDWSHVMRAPVAVRGEFELRRLIEEK